MATTNPWKRFQELLPRAARIIGTVSSHNSNGTSTITLRDGIALTVKGQSVDVGRQVLIEAGAVNQEVPNLPVYEAQV